MPSHFRTIELPTFTDSRGSLSVVERVLPFEVKRIYWIYGVGDDVRGGHRHKVARQALVALNGAVSVHMNDGVASDDILLDRPNLCLLVEPKDWHTMTFKGGAILLVLASEHYDKNDYIEEQYERP